MNPWKKKSGVAVLKSDPIENAFQRSLLILIQLFFGGGDWMANNKDHPCFNECEDRHKELGASIIQCCFRFYSYRKNRSSKVGWKYNEKLHQLVRCRKKPVLDELPDGDLQLQYPYHYVVDGRLYNTLEEVDEDYDTITYWDNEAQEFWEQWEQKKPRSVD